MCVCVCVCQTRSPRESSGKCPCVVVRTESNSRLGDRALEAPSDTRVNALLFSPRRTTNTKELLVLMSLKGLCPLLHNLCLYEGGDLRHLLLVFMRCCCLLICCCEGGLWIAFRGANARATKTVQTLRGALLQMLDLDS